MVRVAQLERDIDYFHGPVIEKSSSERKSSAYENIGEAISAIAQMPLQGIQDVRKDLDAVRLTQAKHLRETHVEQALS